MRQNMICLYPLFAEDFDPSQDSDVFVAEPVLPAEWEPDENVLADPYDEDLRQDLDEPVGFQGGYEIEEDRLAQLSEQLGLSEDPDTTPGDDDPDERDLDDDDIDDDFDAEPDERDEDDDA